MMLVSNLFFSLMAVLVRVNPHLSGIEAAFFRFAIGALFVVTAALFGAIHLRFKDLRGPPLARCGRRHQRRLVLLPINEIGLGKTSLFQYTYPFYAIVFSAIFMKEKVSASVIALLLVAMGGLVLLQLPSLTTGQWNLWVLAAWASGVLSGLAVMYVKKLSATESSTSIFLSQCIGGFWITLLPAQGGGVTCRLERRLLAARHWSVGRRRPIADDLELISTLTSRREACWVRWCLS